jgi:hypothetical protein
VLRIVDYPTPARQAGRLTFPAASPTVSLDETHIDEAAAAAALAQCKEKWVRDASLTRQPRSAAPDGA